MKGRNTFGRHEHLKSSQKIKETVETGNKLFAYPFVLQYSIEASTKSSCQIAFIISKRRYKRAVDRNRIKRLMREAYRHHNAEIKKSSESTHSVVNIVLVYIGKEMLSFDVVQKSCITVLSLLNQKIMDSDN